MQDLVVSVKFTETVDSLFTAGSEVLASSKADIPVIVATTVNAELRVGGMGCALRSRREVIVVVCVHPSQVCAKAASGAPVPNANVSVSLVDPSTGVPVLVNLNFNPKTTTEGVVKGVYDQLADDLVAHFNGIQMGPSGCFTTQQFSFSGASSSLDFDLMFESRGVFASSPLQVSLFTYQDAYRWSISGRWCVSTCTRTAFVFTAVWATTDLSDGLWVPTLMALPLLLSNSLFYRIRLRIVYLSTVQPILVAVACCLTRVAWCRPCCARLWLAWCLYVEAERKRQR